MNGTTSLGIGENLALVPYDDHCSDQHPDFSGYCFVALWMGSPGHRENILLNRYGAIGIGVVCSDRECYATQNFRAGGENVLLLGEGRAIRNGRDNPHTIIITDENRRVVNSEDDPHTIIITDEDRRVVGYDDDPYTYIITDEDKRVSRNVSDRTVTYTVR